MLVVYFYAMPVKSHSYWYSFTLIHIAVAVILYPKLARNKNVKMHRKVKGRILHLKMPRIHCPAVGILMGKLSPNRIALVFMRKMLLQVLNMFGWAGLTQAQEQEKSHSHSQSGTYGTYGTNIYLKWAFNNRLITGFSMVVGCDLLQRILLNISQSFISCRLYI